MTAEARKVPHPALEALHRAPKGDPSLLTDEDRARVAANQEARRLGSKGIPHAAVMNELAERERFTKGA